jgi:hypothetical protein
MTPKETSSTPLGRSDPSLLIEHYTQLALLDGWIEHARHQIMQMEKHPTGIYVGIGKAVAKRIKEINVSNHI